jgi:ABC-2 type transport system permease protein
MSLWCKSIMNFSNIKLIASQEWRNAFRTKVVYISAIVLGVALLTALIISWQNAKTLNNEREKYQDLVRTNWLEQPDRHPHRASHYGYLAFRPKSALSFFDSGVDSFAGTSIFLEPHRQNTVNFSEAQHSTGLLRFGELNLALILQLLVPLLIFFLGFSAISGERESGILAIILSQGISWRELLLGKTIGILSIIIALLLPLLMISFALWFVLNDFRLSSDSALRIGVLIVCYGFHFAVCAAVAVIVSSFTKTSKSSLIALIVIWISFWVAMPRAMQNLGASVYPTVSKSQFDKLLEDDLAKEGDSHNAQDAKFTELKKETLAKYNVNDVRDLPFNYGGFVMGKAEAISSSIFRKHYGELLEKFRSQNHITELASLLNPYLAIRHFSMATAGSDFFAYENFQWQAEDFRFNMVQKLNDLHTNEIKSANDRSQKIDNENWHEFPKFEYREPTISESLGRQILAISSVMFWFFIAFSAVWFLPFKAIK